MFKQFLQQFRLPLLRYAMMGMLHKNDFIQTPPPLFRLRSIRLTTSAHHHEIIITMYIITLDVLVCLHAFEFHQFRFGYP